MARQPIEIGAAPNDGTGDPLRDAFAKVNANEEELYALVTLLAPLLSPALTGNPTAPTQSPGNDTTRIATTAFVTAALNALIAAAPGQLDTLDELAAALGDDANFATTITNALALKAPLASPALTGNPTATTQTAGNNSTRIATTAFVEAVRVALAAADALKADKTEVWRVIAKSAVAVVHTGTTAQTDIVTIPIPAGAMGPNGKLRVDLLISCNNNANQKMHYLLLGGSTLNASNMASSTGLRTNRVIANVNSQSSQKTMPAGSGSYGASSAAIQTTAVNTSGTVNLTFTSLLADAADNVTIEEYTVEVLYGA